MSRNNYKAICRNRVRIMNEVERYPYHGQYALETAGGRYYALFQDTGNNARRISSYLPWPELAEWLDGYMTAVDEAYWATKEA